MDLKCNVCHKCPPLRPVQLPCCERLHCRGCAWGSIIKNGFCCLYSSCSGNPKLNRLYNLAILSTEELVKIQELKTKENNNQSPHSEPKYKCCFCNKGYNGLPAYKSHILTHFESEFKSFLNKSSPYQCPECNESHKNWHTLVRHYAFKEDKFFSVTKTRPEDFPLLVRKYVRRSVPSKDEGEESPPPPPPKKKRIQDSSSAVPPVTKKHKEQTSPRIEKKEKEKKKKKKKNREEKADKKSVRTLIRPEHKIKQCRVEVLEKLDVLRKRRKRLRRKSSTNKVEREDVQRSPHSAAVVGPGTSSGLSAHKQPSPGTKEKKKKKKKKSARRESTTTEDDGEGCESSTQAKWSVACLTLQDWENLAAKYEKSKKRYYCI